MVQPPTTILRHSGRGQVQRLAYQHLGMPVLAGVRFTRLFLLDTFNLGLVRWCFEVLHTTGGEMHAVGKSRLRP